MTTFVEDTWFYVEHCYKCSMAFGMPLDFKDRRRKDRATFYCPAGHAQHYIGETEEQKLRAELERKQQMLDAAKAREVTVTEQRDKIAKAHQKMRHRVMNGVCPCCNRTFQNLMQHMKSEHPGFDVRPLHVLRSAFGMTQADVAREACVDASHVSLFERGKPVAGYAKERIEWWLEEHNPQDAP